MNSEIDNKNSLVEQILSLNLLEAAELVKKMEDKLGLPIGSSAFSGSSAPSIVENNAGPSVAEKTEFNVVLKEFDSAKKIAMIKAVREIDSSLDLKKAKESIESLPAVLVSKAPKEEAEKIKQKLIDAGASKVELE